jgi:UDP-2,3-diacylglucosamine pyrophosphatase LpxH
MNDNAKTNESTRTIAGADPLTSYLILSDLHLGAGGPLEDFLLWGPEPDGPSEANRAERADRLGMIFFRFLQQQREEAIQRGAKPHLLLLGDVLDIWQARRHRQPTERAVSDILSAHTGVVAAIRQWIAAGHPVTWVLGNHDQPLLAPKPWALLREIFPTLNDTVGGAPCHRYVDPSLGLVAEHGHQWDPLNRFRDLTKPNAGCVGRRIVEHLVNNIEPLFPLIDKGADLGVLVELLLHAAEGNRLPALDHLVPDIMHLVSRNGRPALRLIRGFHRALRGILSGCEGVSTTLRAFRLERNYTIGSSAWRALSAEGVRTLVCGHTHDVCVEETVGEDGQSRWLANSGTWRPQVHRREADGQWEVIQPLSAIRVEGEGAPVLLEAPLDQ